MSNAKCAACGKTAYPLESLTAIEKVFHKMCFKCTVCNSTLSLKNFKGFEGKIYCVTHTSKVKASSVADSIAIKSALSAPKKESGVRGIHKADPNVAPQSRGDFSVNQNTGDQSTENRPDASSITYDVNTGDQSTENQPDSSSISYDVNTGDQSTENQPDSSSISYDVNTGDQSTENQPDDSGITYDTYNADQSTEGYGGTTYEQSYDDQGYDEQYQ